MTRNPSILCLGIETSCDETGLALVEDGVLTGHVLASQSDLHALFGGVVPELASREHCRYLPPLFDELMRRTGRRPEELTDIAVSRGPGLLGSLLVGTAFAKGLAFGLGARLQGVDHLHAHLLAAGLEHTLTFPAIGLLVSGGHTAIYRISSPADFVCLGRTIDDAAGEAFDKIGNCLGFSYPAGRAMDNAAQKGKPCIPLPLPYLNNTNLDFSFSGLKTACALKIGELGLRAEGGCSPDVADLCASFNLAVAKTLAEKLKRALAQNPDIRHVILAGGVAANTMIREAIADLACSAHVDILMPPQSLCTDNGAMVAYAGFLQARAGLAHPLTMEAIPRGRRIPDDAVAMA